MILHHVRLYRGTTGADFDFMKDNTGWRQTLAVKELLESENIPRMDWRAYSIDLNSREYIWST